jgi:hypothetical protein
MSHRTQCIVTVAVMYCLMHATDGKAAASVSRGQETQGQASTIRAEELVREFPTFGFAVKRPAGYKDGFVVDVSQATRWISQDKPSRSFLFEVFPIREQSLAEFVREKRGQPLWSGAKEEAASLGGRTAIRLIATSTSPLLPREAIISKYNGYAYSLIRFESDDPAAKADTEAIRNSWKWVPLESPHKHLTLRNSKLSILDGRASFPVPTIMRPFQGEGRTKLGVYSYLQDKYTLIVDPQVVPNPAGQSLDTVRAHFGDQLSSRMKLTEKLQWKEVTGTIPCLITQTVAGTLSDARGTSKMYFRMALVSLDPRTFLVITALIEDMGAVEREPYERCVQRMMEGLVIRTASEGKPGALH